MSTFVVPKFNKESKKNFKLCKIIVQEYKSTKV